MNRIAIEKKVLGENERIAARLRQRFADSHVRCLNLIGSPGAGKTALLERTLAALPLQRRVAVLTGDIQTDHDAVRLGRFGFPVRQITTGGACHLDARMIERALEGWPIEELDLLLIENVGNLVCPTSYDLGEEAKIVVLSVTEGEDKPAKYPGIFAKAAVAVLNKIDLLPHIPFAMTRACDYVDSVHPGMPIFKVSCTTGAGLDGWLAWLNQGVPLLPSPTAP
jgi:hydrogenase nickel incorporation protein HypB